MKLKICGMKYPENIQEVANLQPDYLGFIFYEKSPRFFKGEIPTLPKSTQKVGVFVDAYLDDILNKIRRYNLQIVQLHGNETPEFCKLFQHMDIEVIKVFSVDDTFDFQTITAYETVCDYFLFDAKGQNPGGNGTAFNWEILKNYPSQKPFFLSGGIGLEEIKLIKQLNFPVYAIDVNSKFETKPGMKNIHTVRAGRDLALSVHSDRDLTLSVRSGRDLTLPRPAHTVNENGFYGEFGGAFIPEMLYPNVEELRQNYLNYSNDPEFQSEFQQLLKDYVGRPTPLYFAERLSAKYNTKIYLKREDLCHTGAHKINNTIGQILLAKRLGKTRIIAETGAGQHGVATATVCALMGLQCIVYMGEIDIQRQAPNVARMKMLGSEVVPATSGSQPHQDRNTECITG